MERKYNQPQQEEIKAEETKQESSRDSPAEVAEVTTPTETPVSPSTTTFPDNKETKKKDKTSFDGETTEHQLTSAILATKVREFKPLPGFDPNHDNLQYYRAQQEIDCDEVYPGIYIGDGITAKNKKYLKMLGITHLFNAAEGKRFGFVNTDNNYYADTTIKYLGLPIIDLPIEDISKYFYTAANFIDEAVSTRGKVFVHCMKGISRSATCVLAFLMIKKNMPAIDAIHLIRTSRDVRPNYGFLWQLAQLDNKLRRQRL